MLRTDSALSAQRSTLEVIDSYSNGSPQLIIHLLRPGTTGITQDGIQESSLTTGFPVVSRADANTDTRSRYSETRRDQEPREGRSRRGEGTEEEEEEEERKTEGETWTYSVNTVIPTYILQCERSIARSLEAELFHLPSWHL